MVTFLTVSKSSMTSPMRHALLSVPLPIPPHSIFRKLAGIDGIFERFLNNLPKPQRTCDRCQDEGLPPVRLGHADHLVGTPSMT